MVVLFIIGLTVTKYYKHYNRRRKQSNDLSYSVSTYWRRQFASTSFDSLTSSPPLKTNLQTGQEANETNRIIKSSFSWPEATLLRQQQQGKGECSSPISASSLSNSSTMEHIFETASLTFGLRWDEITATVFVRVINGKRSFYSSTKSTNLH